MTEQLNVLIVGLSKPKSHIFNPLWGEYCRGSWGVFQVTPLELTSLGWLKYESAIECGLIEVVANQTKSGMQMEVCMSQWGERQSVHIPYNDRLAIDERMDALNSLLFWLGVPQVQQMVVLRIEDLTKIMSIKRK